MTLRFHKILTIVIVYLTAAFSSPGQTSSIDTVNLTFDTSNTAIIKRLLPLDNPFDNTFKEATLTQDELQTVDSILKVCVTDYNKSLDQKYKEYSIDIRKQYIKQLVVAINPKGEKEVWVNCVCYAGDIDNDWWKTRIISVEDGGSCFFNFKINLTAKKYYNLKVNPEA